MADDVILIVVIALIAIFIIGSIIRWVAGEVEYRKWRKEDE